MRIVPHDQNSGAIFFIAAAPAPKTKTKEIRFLLTTYVCLVSFACGFMLITLQTFEKGIVLEKLSCSLIEALLEIR